MWPPSSILLRPAAGESVRPNVLVSLFKMSSGLRYGGGILSMCINTFQRAVRVEQDPSQ